MAQDLKLLDAWVSKSNWPHVACPTCGDGFLSLGNLEAEESGESQRNRGHENWEPEFIHGTFHGVLNCAKTTCGETVSIGGEYGVDMRLAPDGSWFGEYEDRYRLRFALPALTILKMPTGTPEKVEHAVRSAAEVLWLDSNAAANRLRLAVESLLTAHGVRRFAVRNHKRRRLSTHERIMEFKHQEAAAAEALEAVKWIGNAGSHADELSVSDVLEGAVFLEYALRLLYDDNDDRLRRRIRSVNKSKGLPRSKVQRSR